MLDHIGSPIATLGNKAAGASAYDGKETEIVASWKRAMLRIATDCPNVAVKVGGSGMPLLGHGFDKRERPPSSQEVAEMLQVQRLQLPPLCCHCCYNRQHLYQRRCCFC